MTSTPPRRRKTSSSSSDLFAVAGGLMFVLLLAALIVTSVVSAAHTQDYRGCTVTDKDRTRGTDGKSDARVYTSCGVFTVSDSILSTRWDSADVYSRVQVGTAYDIHARGYRIPFLSRFPNILTAEVSR